MGGVDVIASEDQRLLQESTRRFVERHAPVEALRELISWQQGFDRHVWVEGASQGWVSLFVPEAHGGFAEAAQGVVDAAIVAEELGRVVFPGPFLSSCVVAFAVAMFGTEAQKTAVLTGLAGGSRFAAWCLAGGGAMDGIAPGSVTAEPRQTHLVLNGKASFVQDADIADHLLVTAQRDEGMVQCLIPSNANGVEITPLDTLDLGRRLADVTFSDVTVEADQLLGRPEESAVMVERQLQVALVLQCAETVGVVDRALDFTLDYVKQRYAFGQPIGSFQGLKHRLADHATQLEGAKAAVAHAARAVQSGAGDAAIAVSIAKSQTGRFGTEIVRDCLHMHGGIGMTWDHDIHLYLRRVVSNEALWGTPAIHHERLCRLAGL